MPLVVTVDRPRWLRVRHFFWDVTDLIISNFVLTGLQRQSLSMREHSSTKPYQFCTVVLRTLPSDGRTSPLIRIALKQSSVIEFLNSLEGLFCGKSFWPSCLEAVEFFFWRNLNLQKPTFDEICVHIMLFWTNVASRALLSERNASYVGHRRNGFTLLELARDV